MNNSLFDIKYLTIVIPTYNNRHYYLKRALNYHVHHNIEILIADSSPKPFPETEEYRNFSHVHYYHYPFASYTEKLNNILEKITTPYTLLLADDDFITLSGIKLCIEFLQKNKDYASAQGNIVCFIMMNKKVNAYPHFYHMAGLEINNTSSLERVKSIFDQNNRIYYSVHRTETIKQTFSITRSFKDDFIGGMIEYFLDVIAIINGKHKVLSCFYSAEELSPNSATHAYLWPPSLRESIKYRNQYEECLDILSSYLSQKENLSFSKAKIVIDYAFHSSPYFTQKSIPSNFVYPLHRFPVLKKMIDAVPGSSFLKTNYSRLWYKYLRYKWKSKMKKSIVEVKEKNLPAYPFTDVEALAEWIKIKKVIKNMKNS